MHLTPTEQKIIDLLKDGLPHSRHDMISTLQYASGDFNALAQRIFFLRRKVRLLGQDIVTALCKGGIHYQHVILLSGKDPLGFDPIEG